MAEKGADESFIDTSTILFSELISSSTDLDHYLCEFFMSGRREITILLSGKTGAGKSHLTNALIGKELAKEGEELDPQRDDVSYLADWGKFPVVSADVSSVVYACTKCSDRFRILSKVGLRNLTYGPPPIRGAGLPSRSGMKCCVN